MEAGLFSFGVARLKRTKTKQPELLGRSLFDVLRSLGIESKVKEHEAIARWPEIAGPQIGEISEADRVIDGVLFVKVKNSVWRNELIFLKRDLFQQIDKKIGRGIIKDIRFI